MDPIDLLPFFFKKKGPTVPVRVCRVGRAIWYASATTPLPGLLYSFLSLYFLFDLFGSQWQMDFADFCGFVDNEPHNWQPTI